MKIVKLEDTGATVRVVHDGSVKPNPSPSGDGWGWIDATDNEDDFRVLSLWGTDGWDLGCWPYIVFASSEHDTEEGSRVYGYATYVEGDLGDYWYSTREARDLAISKEAWWYWCSGQADCPEELEGKDPEKFEVIEKFAQPFVGFGC